MKTAVIYARYSSDSQTEQSIEGQLRVCKDYAKSNNILIIDTYIDRAMTGTNDRRPDFQRMIKDSANKCWDYVIVYKLDRFSRNKYEIAIHKHTLKNNGVRVISATEFIPDTPEGIILESMLEGYAEYYSRELSQKINRGIRESRLKGLFCGGGLPYGYKVEDKKIYIDEEPAKVVRYIYERYSIGVTVPDIVKELQDKEILHKGLPFKLGNVYKILENEKYTGIYRAKTGEVFDKIYPRIIEQELFDRVKKISQRNKFNRHSHNVVYLLKNKIVCGYCGSNVTADSGTTKKGKVIQYYKCAGRKRKHIDCELNTMQKDVIEKAVVNHIIKSISSPQTISKVVDVLYNIQEEQFAENKYLKILKDQKVKVDMALQNIMTAIENGIISNTTSKRLHELEEEQSELEKNILLEQSKQVEKLTREEIETYYKKALKLEPQLLIEYLVSKVKVYNGYIEIIYNTPMEANPDESQGFSLYRGKSILKRYNNNVGNFENNEFLIEIKL